MGIVLSFYHLIVEGDESNTNKINTTLNQILYLDSICVPFQSLVELPWNVPSVDLWN
jgi:hypothetical protein